MSNKNMNQIISLISDGDLEKALSRNVQERLVEQKFFYVSSKMAKYYYDSASISTLSGQDYWDFLRKNISKKEKIAIISLGCGNSWREKDTLQQLKKAGYQFVYIGVDTSKYMIQMAEKNLANLNIEKMFIQADITSERFKDVITRLTKDYQTRVYAFYGTFGNVNQTYMADVLYNLLQKGDLLWLDITTRASLNREDDIKLFKYYSSRLSVPGEISFYFGPLESIGAKLNSGSIGLKVNSEKSVGSLLFTFYFKILKKTIITNFMKEQIHLLPGEEIELINIRAHYPKTFINFFKEHDFKLLDRKQKGIKEQFMFKKST